MEFPFLRTSEPKSYITCSAALLSSLAVSPCSTLFPCVSDAIAIARCIILFEVGAVIVPKILHGSIRCIILYVLIRK